MGVLWVIPKSTSYLYISIDFQFFLHFRNCLGSARHIKLKLLAESGDNRANKILHLQENSAGIFATSQIGLNAVAILGSIVGSLRFVPTLWSLISPWISR